jgi:hypothetical protein
LQTSDTLAAFDCNLDVVANVEGNRIEDFTMGVRGLVHAQKLVSSTTAAIHLTPRKPRKSRSTDFEIDAIATERRVPAPPARGLWQTS